MSMVIATAGPKVEERITGLDVADVARLADCDKAAADTAIGRGRIDPDAAEEGICVDAGVVFLRADSCRRVLITLKGN